MKSSSNYALEVKDVTLGFYGSQILRGVDFSISDGAFAGLIGPNGAGKSTLFNVVSGYYRPNSGKILIHGVESHGARPDAIVRRGLVRTFQLARGFPKLSVFQHLMLYGPGQPGEKLADAIFSTKRAIRRESELAHKAREIAERLRLTSVLDHAVTALSGGQKKLVEIGRALMADPKIILLDEPMAGVNPTLAAEIADHLIALNASGITICLIEHDMSLIRRLCPHVVVMAEGRKLIEGSFDTVANDPHVQDAYLGHRQ